MARFYFDASVLVALYEGLDAFAGYRDAQVVTDGGMLYEFARHIVKTRSSREARAALANLSGERIFARDDDFVEAAKLARRHPRLSAQDTLGYVLARREHLTFLTRDGAFRGFPGVRLA